MIFYFVLAFANVVVILLGGIIHLNQSKSLKAHSQLIPVLEVIDMMYYCA